MGARRSVARMEAAEGKILMTEDAIALAHAIAGLKSEVSNTDNAVGIRELAERILAAKRKLVSLLTLMPESELRAWRKWADGSRDVRAVLQEACADALRALKTKPAPKAEKLVPDVADHLRFQRMRRIFDAR